MATGCGCRHVIYAADDVIPTTRMRCQDDANTDNETLLSLMAMAYIPNAPITAINQVVLTTHNDVNNKM